MEFTNGEDRILYIKFQGAWLPVACLTGNTFSETSSQIPTTTRDNDGWSTFDIIEQSYSISFNGLQINSTVEFGTFTVASYDKLKLSKRNKTLLEWKIQGKSFPIVDFGKCRVTELSEASNVDEFLSFSGVITGFGIPKTASLYETVLNNGDPEVILVTNLDNNLIIKTK